MNKIKKHILLWFMVLLVVLVSGCGGSSSSTSQPSPQPGGSSSSTSQPSPQQGILSVSLTDAPTTGFDAVNVTVTEVRVHQSSVASENDPGWSEITLNPPKKINLLDLSNCVLENLGQTYLPAGHYTQLRLVLAMNKGANIANSVVLSGTTPTAEIPLVTPSAAQSGIKLINEFEVAAGQRVDLVLDFDALKSIVSTGNGKFLLKPVIRVLPTAIRGIDGFVDTSLLGDNPDFHVMVSSQASGSVVRSMMPDPQTGEFFLTNLGAGNYDLVITADRHATAVIAGVPVSICTATAVVTMVSTSAAPITLPTSTMHTISGTVTTNPTSSLTTVAYVAAMQTFTGGPTVTVKSTTADLTSGGTYTLVLPAGAPLLGQYGLGTLPIVLAPQSAVTGTYTAEASASGYPFQSSDVNISIADVIQNFTLKP